MPEIEELAHVDEKIEHEIEKQEFPKVKPEYIDQLIKKIDFVFGRISEARMMCSAVLDGFVIADGFGACIDPRNFDEEIGKQIAIRQCVEIATRELWKLEGYRLSRSLNEGQ